MKRFLLLFLLLFPPLPSSYLLASSSDGLQHRVQWNMNESYSGPHQDSFNKLRWEVPNLMRQTMIDIAVKLGLNFEEGWACPLTIGFVDQAPYGVENVLAYVQLMVDDQGKFSQVLNVNLQAYHQSPFNFKKVFAHELVHAMLNDALETEAHRAIPVWLHEGLAVYGADQGEQMVEVYVTNNNYEQNRNFLNGLEGPHGALDYAEDYLAIKYMHDRHGVNSVHNFMREVVRRKGDIPGAIEYTCFESWEKFQANAREFGQKEILDIHRSKRSNTNRFNRSNSGSPY